MPEQIEEPFALLKINMAHFDAEAALQKMLDITNALTAMYQKSNENRQKIIALGSKPKAAEGYETINTERYDIEAKIDALKAKRDAVSQVLFWKSSEMKHWGQAA